MATATAPRKRTTTLAERGVAILETRHIITQPDGWLVESSQPGQFYRVSRDGACCCPDFVRRQRVCKHMTAVRQMLEAMLPQRTCRRCGVAVQKYELCGTCARADLDGVAC